MVEDDESTREMTSLALSCEGFGVVSAKDAEAAWQALRDGRPDLILVDLHMPNLDGLGFVDELHRHEAVGLYPRAGRER